MESPPVRPLLQRHAPLLRYASGERHGATSVEHLTALPLRGEAIALRPRRGVRRPDVTYARASRGTDGRLWLQYWFLHEDNPKDNGVVRTGRHEGDWEVVQVGLEPGTRRPQQVTFAQHSWAEGCAWSRIERSGTAPVVYVAGASHASYVRSGRTDRPFPLPGDHADGRGRAVRPQVRAFGSWVRWPGRWGRTEARPFVPTDSSSPRGPAFQPAGPFVDPAAFQARARPCGSGAPPHPWPVRAAVLALLAALLLGTLRLVRRSRSG